MEGPGPAPVAGRWGITEVLLALGALMGAGLAAVNIAGARAAAAPADAVVVVGGVPITDAEYARALEAAQTDRRGGALSDSDRARVLDRLVDEELLFQRAQALDLTRRDRRLRAEIVSTVIADLTDGAAVVEPSDDELRAWLAEHAARFAAEPSVRIEQLYFAVPSEADPTAVRARAEAARVRILAGARFADLAGAGDRPLVDAPGGLASRAALTQAFGPTVARACLELDVGQLSEPLQSGTGFHLVRVLERAPGGAPTFEAARDRIRADYVRHAGDARLREALVRLRADAEIRVRAR